MPDRPGQAPARLTQFVRALTGRCAEDPMPDRPWKAEERAVARMIGGRRYPANQGGAIDCESSWLVVQVKHRRVCSLAELEALALDAERPGVQRRKVGAVVVKRRAGAGRRTPRLVIMTEGQFTEMSGRLPA